MKFLRCFSLCLFFCVLNFNVLYGQFGKNKVQYEEIEWLNFSTEHFSFYYEEGSEFLAEFTALESERFYQVFKKLLKYELVEKVPIIIYDAPNQFLQTNVISDILPEGVQGFTEGFKSRVVLPFNGNYNDFRHTLHHELTHAIYHHFLYGGKIQNLINKRRFIQLPLWFEEGIPEFISTYWDTEADMIMRDARIYGYLPPMEYLYGYFAYKGGQAFYFYVNEKYGEEKIGELLRNTKTVNTLDQVFEKTFGMKLEKFSEQWSKWVKKRYWKELSFRKEVHEFAKPFTDHTKDESYFNMMPALSPDGQYVAFFSDKNDYTGLYVRSTIDKKKEWSIMKSGQKGNLESFHLFNSRVNWSHDSRFLVFGSKRKNKDIISIYDMEKKKVFKDIFPQLDGLSSPSFFSNDSIVVFSGFNKGHQDLYSYHIYRDSLVKITDDPFTAMEPVVSPDGKKIAFMSDRPANINETSMRYYEANLGYNKQNIYILNLASNRVIPVTDDKNLNESPQWSPDGGHLGYISDKNGILNIYLYDLENRKSKAVTNILSGCKHLSWSRANNKIAFTSFYKGGWDIFIINHPKKQADYVDSPLELTDFASSSDKERFYRRYLDLPYGKSLSIARMSGVNTGKIVFKYHGKLYYIDRFGSGAKEEKKVKKAVRAADAKDSVMISSNEEKKDTSSVSLTGQEYVDKVQNDIDEALPYLISFSPDIATGNFYYDTYYGMGGQAVFSFSDVMSDHRILIYSDLYYSFENSDIQLVYYYLPKKWDLGLSLFHLKNEYMLTSRDILSTRRFGGFAQLSYPFNTYSRMDFTLNFFQMKAKKYYYYGYYDAVYLGEEEDLMINIFQTRYVFDNILYGTNAPSNGWRYYVSYEKSLPLRNRDVDFQRIKFDYRKYFNFKREYTLALRLTGGTSFGKDPQKFYLGGVSNWLNYQRKRYDNWNMSETYLSELVIPMRAYDFYEKKGDNALLFNMEFRFNFIDYLIFHWPMRFGFFSIGGLFFTDMGMAWNENDEVRFMKDGRLHSPIASYGYGLRFNVGFAILRVDVGYPTDFKSFKSSPRVLYSFGIDF